MQNMSNIDPDLLWRRSFKAISTLVLFLPAVLVAQQYQQTNGSSDFAVASGMPAAFIFASFDGTILAWNPGVNLHAAIQKVPGSASSILTGATIAQVEKRRFLYVADLEAGKIKLYNTDFQLAGVDQDAFNDDQLPSGFAPFNIQNINDNNALFFTAGPNNGERRSLRNADSGRSKADASSWSKPEMRRQWRALESS
jgi:hypothetical protein